MGRFGSAYGTENLQPTKTVTISNLMHHLFIVLFDFAGHGSKTCLKGHVH